MDIKPTADECIAEGQLKYEYFPTCSDDTAMTAFVQSRIDSCAVKVKRQVSTTDWASTDEDVIQELHDCIVFYTLARLWQNIINVMLAYDDESLPPEFVDPAQCAVTRDYYSGEAASILVRYDTSANKGAFIGAFGSCGIEDTDESILGLTY